MLPIDRESKTLLKVAEWRIFNTARKAGPKNLQHHKKNRARDSLATLNTTKGLLRFRRLLYGVASAPGVWQKHIDQILRDIPGVQCILDDILITGATEQEHLENLTKVHDRIKESGLTLNRKNVNFLKLRLNTVAISLMETDYIQPQVKLRP